MSMTTNDVIHRSVKGESSHWISEIFLLRTFDSLTENHFKVHRHRYMQDVPTSRQSREFLPDTGKSWRWGKQNGTYYYCINNIPDKAPQNYRSRLPHPELFGAPSHATHNPLIDRLHNAINTNSQSFIHAYAHLASQQRDQLTKACAVVQLAIDDINGGRACVNKNTYFIALADSLEAVGVTYLPLNYRRLKEKIVEVLQGAAITDVIRLKREGNQNRALDVDAEIKSWMYQLRSMGQNYSNEYIIRKILQMCKITGKASPSRSWYSERFASHYVKQLTAEHRFGTGSRKASLYSDYIPGTNALFPGDCWQMDGTRVNLIPHNGKKGKEFLYIIAVRDVHSGDILGWHFDTVEDRYGYLHAIKMAVSHAGYLPYQLILDKFPGHNTSDWQALQESLVLAGVEVTYTSKSTGKAQIERWFGTLQSVFMPDSSYYYGEGIQSRRDAAHRSSEYLKTMRRKAHKEGWDFDLAWQEGNKIIEAYRHTPYSFYSRKNKLIDQSPKELHATTEKPHVINIEPWEFISLFGFIRKESITHNGLIKMQIHGVDYYYTVDNYDIVAHHRQVYVGYEMDDLSSVYLYSFDNRRTFLCQVFEQRIGPLMGPNADHAGVANAKTRIKNMRQQRQADLDDKIADASEVDILMGAHVSKEVSESAQTKYLVEREGEWKKTTTPKIKQKAIIQDDPGDIDIDSLVRNQY